jgi:ribose 1,5-bisphosphate isomerase
MVHRGVQEAAERISRMEVRGAGAISREAAEALRKASLESQARNREDFLKEMREAGEILIASRPSAVSLPNAVRYLLHRLENSPEEDLERLKRGLVQDAEAFIRNSLEAVRRIGEIGANRITDGDRLLTHCNSKAALAILTTAWKQGKEIRVTVTESRPRYQGHLTARELAAEGIPVSLIADSAVRSVMRKIDKVVVGADSIAANGAVINKIGTAQIALIAKAFRSLFFVAAETYKFHPATVVGELVEIETRDPEEVADPGEFPGVEILNPAFDVTPPEYIDLIVTEKGVIPPQAALTIIREEFGWALPGEGGKFVW